MLSCMQVEFLSCLWILTHLHLVVLTSVLQLSTLTKDLYHLQAQYVYYWHQWSCPHVALLQFNDLRGKGSFPTAGCSREDCDFYFRWGRNPNNPNYLTFFVSADLSRGWAAVGVSTDKRMVSIKQYHINLHNMHAIQPSCSYIHEQKVLGKFNIIEW